MRVAVVTDSAAAIPRDVADAYGLVAAPIQLDDGHTAAPAPGAFALAIREQLERGADGVVVVTLTATFSASFQSATVAAREFGERVMVVDSGTAAGGQALVVLATATAARDVDSLASARSVAERAAREVYLVGTLPDLSHLARSGRVPRFAGWAGARLRVSPLFELRAGSVQVLRPARTRHAAAERMVRRVRQGAGAGRCLHVIALHACADAAAEALLARVAAEHAPATAFVAEFGPTLVAHTGPGVLGLAWRWSDPAREPVARE